MALDPHDTRRAAVDHGDHGSGPRPPLSLLVGPRRNLAPRPQSSRLRAGERSLVQGRTVLGDLQRDFAALARLDDRWHCFAIGPLRRAKTWSRAGGKHPKAKASSALPDTLPARVAATCGSFAQTLFFARLRQSRLRQLARCRAVDRRLARSPMPPASAMALPARNDQDNALPRAKHGR